MFQLTFLVSFCWWCDDAFSKFMKTKQQFRILFNYGGMQLWGEWNDGVWCGIVTWVEFLNNFSRKIRVYMCLCVCTWIGLKLNSTALTINQHSFHRVKWFHTWNDWKTYAKSHKQKSLIRLTSRTCQIQPIIACNASIFITFTIR